MRLSVFLYRHEKFLTLPTLLFDLTIVSANVPRGTDANGLRDRIKQAVTDWAREGSEDAEAALAYGGDDFNIGDLSNCLYNDEDVGDDDDGSLVACLKRHGVEDLVIESPETGDWTYDTPLVEPFEDDEE
jgi:hypothetical protein